MGKPIQTGAVSGLVARFDYVAVLWVAIIWRRRAGSYGAMGVSTIPRCIFGRSYQIQTFSK